jgi:glycosyltransferase involved in cell wall biosynthesis
MIHSKRVCVVMPAYNAEATLRQTVDEIPHDLVDDIIVVDDASADSTAEVARALGLHVVVHPKNRGYGGNQKTCYREALARGADIVVMVHPDYQYAPPLISALAATIASNLYPIAIGSRILGTGALKGGMPLYKYVANRALTFVQNLLLGYKLSEYHTGFRAFSREVLEGLPLEENGEGFVFDNQMLAQAIYFGYEICEVTCPTRYHGTASSISFMPSVRYGLGVLVTSVLFRAARWGIARPRIFSGSGRRLFIASAVAAGS